MVFVLPFMGKSVAVELQVTCSVVEPHNLGTRRYFLSQSALVGGFSNYGYFDLKDRFCKEMYLGGVESAVLLPDPYLSSCHARISRGLYGGLRVRDLGSTNGSYVTSKNGLECLLPADENNPLEIGDSFTLGKSRFEIIGEREVPRRFFVFVCGSDSNISSSIGVGMSLLEPEFRSRGYTLLPLIGDVVSTKSVLDTIGRLHSQGGIDDLWVHFHGHGAQDGFATQFNVILPDYFLRKVSTMAERKVISIDSCYSGVWMSGYNSRDCSSMAVACASAPSKVAYCHRTQTVDVGEPVGNLTNLIYKFLRSGRGSMPIHSLFSPSNVAVYDRLALQGGDMVGDNVVIPRRII